MDAKFVLGNVPFVNMYIGKWYYLDPKIQNICEYDDITDLIPPPKPSGSNKYTVEKIEKYWGWLG